MLNCDDDFELNAVVRENQVLLVMNGDDVELNAVAVADIPYVLLSGKTKCCW